MKSYQPSRSPCPVGRASRILGDRWVLLIMREALRGITRFDDFIPATGINRAALTSRLQMLVDGGIMERDPPEGRRAEYRLTAAGRDLAPTITSMGQWGYRWLFEESEPKTFEKYLEGDEK